MDVNSFWEQRIFGIKRWELGLVVLLYLFFGLAYDLTLLLTSGGTAKLYPAIFYEYGIKALLTIPIWWLMFRRLAEWSIRKKVLLHLTLWPIFTLGQQQLYYLICDLTGEWHLGWPGAWWDIYIPGLFYVLQFGIFHVYDYYLKLQQQKELASELRQLALASELTALKAQLNPHFLYNTFNTISASLPPNQERTREMIAKLSDLFRYQLKASKTELIPLKAELDFVSTYLELEKARFEERLEYNYDIESHIEHEKVPPMILQPLVENSIKHGISKKIEGGRVDIKVYEISGDMCFEIIDSGIGLGGETVQLNKGVGLTNTNKRLQRMYGTEIEIYENDRGGVSVVFHIPIVSN